MGNASTVTPWARSDTLRHRANVALESRFGASIVKSYCKLLSMERPIRAITAFRAHFRTGARATGSWLPVSRIQSELAAPLDCHYTRS